MTLTVGYRQTRDRLKHIFKDAPAHTIVENYFQQLDAYPLTDRERIDLTVELIGPHLGSFKQVTQDLYNRKVAKLEEQCSKNGSGPA